MDLSKGQATFFVACLVSWRLVFAFCGFFERVADIFNVLANALNGVAGGQNGQHEQKC